MQLASLRYVDNRHLDRLKKLMVQVRPNIPQDEFLVLESNLLDMVQTLEASAHVSNQEQPTIPPLLNVNESNGTSQTGRPGRPKLEINPAILSLASQNTGPSLLAQFADCSSRTIRRRLLEAGIATPGQPVFTTHTNEDGSTVSRRSGTHLQPTTLTDEQLDHEVRTTLTMFPNFGQQMIAGHLLSRGHRVTRDRIRDSYRRVHGAPASFGRRRIQRREYRVPGPNSLWHHDGQHGQFYPRNDKHTNLAQTGMIRFRVVIHGFIDGYSRLVTALRAHNNNRSQTVLDLFMDAITIHGCPSRVRGDHGVENLLVAEFMDVNFGHERGSYIWGR